MRYATVISPIGELLLVGDEDGRIAGLCMQDGPRPRSIDPAWTRDEHPFALALRQLGEYFAAQRTRFDLELSPVGSDFQLCVWRALTEIPYGATESYGELATRVGSISARAVGRANGQNPISVIVPCHRVIGGDGSLTGFGGGIERKRLLLELESGVGALAL